MRRATSSLPTPVSPVIRTGRSERATRSTLSSRRRMRGSGRGGRRRSIRAAVSCSSRATAPLRAHGPFEPLDQARRAHGGAGERAEGGEKALVQPVEGARLERVGGEGADDLAALDERAAEAGVDVAQGVRVGGEHAVERIGQIALRRKAHRTGRAQDDVEARVVAPGVAAHQRLLGEPERGERDQFVSLEAQQGDGIGGDRPGASAVSSRS